MWPQRSFKVKSTFLRYNFSNYQHMNSVLLRNLTLYVWSIIISNLSDLLWIFVFVLRFKYLNKNRIVSKLEMNANIIKTQFLQFFKAIFTALFMPVTIWDNWSIQTIYFVTKVLSIYTYDICIVGSDRNPLVKGHNSNYNLPWLLIHFTILITLKKSKLEFFPF